MQEGNIGLMYAIDKLDHRRGFRLSTYAVWWIRHAIQRALANQAPMIRLPVHLLDDRAKIMRTRRQLDRSKGDPTAAEIASATEIPIEKVDMILNLVREPVSLDAPLGTESEVRLGDLLANDSSPHPEEELSRMHEIRRARALLGRLSARERKVIERRFGLDGQPAETLATIGETMSLTRERIRQIEGMALEKLRALG